MKKQTTSFRLAGFLLYFSAFAILMVSAMAFMNPQDVMDLVQVKLSNNDAFSSIRGVYGGVGLAIIAVILYCVKNDRRLGLLFLSILWGGYAFSRLLTILVEGQLGQFGTQWLIIESVLCIAAISLYASAKKTVKTVSFA
jgi:hypothetical protein